MSSATAVARAAYISTPSVPTTTNTSTSTSTRNLIVFGATPPNPALTWRRRRRRNYSAGAGRGGGSSLRQFPSLSRPFFRIPCHSLNPKTVFTHSRRFSPVMEWQDCTYAQTLPLFQSFFSVFPTISIWFGFHCICIGNNSFCLFSFVFI